MRWSGVGRRTSIGETYVPKPHGGSLVDSLRRPIQARLQSSPDVCLDNNTIVSKQWTLGLTNHCASITPLSPFEYDYKAFILSTLA